MMRISILTLFPEMFRGPFDVSIIGRAQKKHAVDIHMVNLRDYATGAYKSVDDHPYGGGIGMILRVDVVDRAISAIKKTDLSQKIHTVLLDPSGVPYKEKDAQRLTTYTHLILVCAHYEGVDERIRGLVDEEISVGDYILTGGELPAMIVTDSIVRLIPGVLTKKEATVDESFGPSGILEYPQYTRPDTYKKQKVPSILLSGNHAEIHSWRKREAQKRTKIRRPDLLFRENENHDR